MKNISIFKSNILFLLLKIDEYFEIYWVFWHIYCVYNVVSLWVSRACSIKRFHRNLFLFFIFDWRGWWWKVVDKIFSGYTWYKLYNKTQIKNFWYIFRTIEASSWGNRQYCQYSINTVCILLMMPYCMKNIYRKFFIGVLLWNVYPVYPENIFSSCSHFLVVSAKIIYRYEWSDNN